MISLKTILLALCAGFSVSLVAFPAQSLSPQCETLLPPPPNAGDCQQIFFARTTADLEFYQSSGFESNVELIIVSEDPTAGQPIESKVPITSRCDITVGEGTSVVGVSRDPSEPAQLVITTAGNFRSDGSLSTGEGGSITVCAGETITTGSASTFTASRFQTIHLSSEGASEYRGEIDAEAGTTTIDSGDALHLFFGMRTGGASLFALDVLTMDGAQITVDTFQSGSGGSTTISGSTVTYRESVRISSSPGGAGEITISNSEVREDPTGAATTVTIDAPSTARESEVRITNSSVTAVTVTVSSGGRIKIGDSRITATNTLSINASSDIEIASSFLSSGGNLSLDSAERDIVVSQTTCEAVRQEWKAVTVTLKAPKKNQQVVRITASESATFTVSSSWNGDNAIIDINNCTFNGVATGNTCEICDNGMDDDLDGATDCADSNCANHPACAPAPEFALTTDPNQPNPARIATGTPATFFYQLNLAANADLNNNFYFVEMDPDAPELTGELPKPKANGQEMVCVAVAPSATSCSLATLTPGTTVDIEITVTVQAGRGAPPSSPGKLITRIQNSDGSNIKAELIDNFIIEILNETICDDGADNDGDGLTDCADPDCAGDPACPQLVMTMLNAPPIVTTECNHDATYTASVENQSNQTIAANANWQVFCDPGQGVATPGTELRITDPNEVTQVVPCTPDQGGGVVCPVSLSPGLSFLNFSAAFVPEVDPASCHWAVAVDGSSLQGDTAVPFFESAIDIVATPSSTTITRGQFLGIDIQYKNLTLGNSIHTADLGTIVTGSILNAVGGSISDFFLPGSSVPCQRSADGTTLSCLLFDRTFSGLARLSNTLQSQAIGQFVVTPVMDCGNGNAIVDDPITITVQ